MTKKQPSTKKQSKKISFEQKFSFVAGIVAIIFFSLMAISSIFLQKSLKEESLDTRRDASVSRTTSAFLSSTPRALTLNREEIIDLAINTNNNAISGIQLEFEIFGSFRNTPTLSINDQVRNRLQIAYQEVRAIRAGEYYVRTIIVPTEIASSFSSNSNVAFLNITLIPTREETISLSFNPYETIASRFDTGENVLASTPPFNFDVVSNELVLCPAPTNLRIDSFSCSNSGNLTLVTRWNQIVGVDQYQVSLSRNPESIGATTTTASNSHTFTNIASGQWYIKVRALQSSSCLVNNDPSTWQTVYFNHTCSSQCEYGFGEWSACTNGWQTRTYTASPSTCEPPPESALRRACSQQCQYNYTNWSACSNGWQTRTYSVSPENCFWYEPGNLEELSRRCENQVVDRYLYLYNYESCWHGNSPGNSTYIYWDDSVFANATWIDISRHSDFREFAHKNISGETQRYYNYLITTGAGFRWNRSGSPTFSFEPNTTYYVRLYNDRHSQVERFFMPACSGVGGVSYRQCNESCSNNRDCAPNLTCHNNACRLATNPTSAICAPSSAGTLNRSCNEYCADNRECASGYVCSWNRCRNPLNLTDLDCRNTSTSTNSTTYRTLASLPQVEIDVTKYCNAYCNYNRDCGPNFRCLQNQCRLAINPNSSTCSASTLEKGSSNDLDENSLDLTLSGTIRDEEDEQKEDMSAKTIVDEEEIDFSNQTALDALKEYLKSKGYSLQQLGLMILGAVLALILLSFLKKTLFGPTVIKNSKSTGQSSPTAFAKKSEENNSTQSSSKELKTNNQPIANLEHPIIPQNKDVDIAKPVQTVSPNPLASSQSADAPKNAMLERIKSKGIEMPKQD